MSWPAVRQVLKFAMAVLMVPGSQLVRGADRFAGFDDYVRAAMEKWQVPGVAIAVVKDGEVVIARAYGVCERGTDHQVTLNTLFPIASCAKSFTAACLGMLVDEGKLNWDDPVAKHLTELELSDPYLTKHATLRDLLSHRTGLQRCDFLGDGADFSTPDILRRLKLVPTVAPLRTKYTYSNSMFTVLGEVVARSSGRPEQRFLTERVFRPLDMSSTMFKATEIPADRLALRHWRSDEGIVARRPDQGIHSTVGDMAKWLKFHLAEGVYGGRRLLKSETVREMHAMQFSVPVRSRPNDNIYAAHFFGSGLGWFVQDYRGHKVVLHAGSWGSMVAMIPDEHLGVVVLSNLDLESLPGMLMYDVFDAYLVGPETAWNQEKWNTWLRNEPPGYAYRPRDEAKTRLEKSHVAGTTPLLSPQKYVGVFESDLYGPITVLCDGDKLSLKVGEIKTPLSHWQNESFYARAPTKLTFDWLLTFGASKRGQVTDVTIKHVGWDKDEKDQVFVRIR
jgi:CubicO group peptidase (beta-lactamase class C family)